MDKNLALDAIILLTQEDRRKLVSALNEIIPYKAKVVTSFNEMDPQTCVSYKNLIILGSVVQSSGFRSKLDIYNEVYNFECYYISLEKVWVDAMRGVAKSFQLDHMKMDYKMLLSVLYGDKTVQSDYAGDEDSETIKDLAKTLAMNYENPEQARVANAYLSLENLITEYQVREQEMQQTCDKLAQEVIAYQEEARRQSSAYKELFAKIQKVNAFISQMNVINAKDVYEKVNVESYERRPFILYLKEWEELLFFNTFLDTLHDAFRIQKRLSVKVLRVYDSSASKHALKLPDHYKVVPNEFRNSDIYESDFLARFGGYEKILDVILTNPIQLDVLILVDHNSHSDTILSGGYLAMNLCRAPKNLARFGLSEANTIVNNDSSLTYSLNYLKQLKNAKSNEEKFLILANTELVSSILSLYANASGRGDL